MARGVIFLLIFIWDESTYNKKRDFFFFTFLVLKITKGQICPDRQYVNHKQKEIEKNNFHLQLLKNATKKF